MAEKLTFKIYRYDPTFDKEPYYKEYYLDYDENWTILDYLNEIKWHQDSALTYRRSCRHAICGSCAMRINRVNRLACQTHIKELKSTNIILEPLKAYPVIKDLVVDLTEFYEKIEAIKPWLEVNRPIGDKEIHQTAKERSIVEQAVTCILCGACTSSCPTYWTNKDYPGPAALYKSFRFAFDSRDDAFQERLDIVNDKNGLYGCHTIFNCVESCPKNLNPTHGISELKKACLNEKLK